MSYLAYYRAFRPTTFDEVVRQEHIVQILKNQIKEDKIGHAYLFCGPRGTGKTTLAKIFARAVNCENPKDGSPCGVCPTCRALSLGGNLDISEIDAASNNGVDEMRDLREKVQYPPVNGRYKVYIIDEVHMLSSAAFNAVLKTLEEPPSHAMFILATTEPQKIPATILSRCMRFDFKLIPREDLENLIRSVFDRTGKKYEEEAVTAIARAGAGSARDSLSIADMCASFSDDVLTYEDVNEVLGSADFGEISATAEAILSENQRDSLEGVEKILATGKSVGVFVRDLLNFLNWTTLAKMCRNAEEIINLPADRFKRVREIAEEADGHKILRVSEILTKAETDLRFAINPRITLETAVLRASMPSADYDMEALMGRLAALEKKIESGAVTVTKYVEIPAAGASPAHAPSAGENRGYEYSSHDGAGYFGEERFAAKDVVAVPVERLVPGNDKSEPAPSEETLFDSPAEGERPASATDSAIGIYAKLMKALRTTHINAVVFTLCTDLSARMEGKRFVLLTDREEVYRGLNKEANRSSVEDVLKEFGVDDFDIRLESSEQTDMESISQKEEALRTLKENFGEDLVIK
ncbi:MAG: DNA polymerase III subunit gamma/tau [Clostridia bacterium]|nr:DNA polymerase III subunit gamma/tau [Clostridia bacterium]